MSEQIEQCPSCTRSKYDPFRCYSKDGKIVAGCIDDFHTGHLTPISQSNSWHNRPEAKRWRRAVAKHLKPGYRAQTPRLQQLSMFRVLR